LSRAGLHALFHARVSECSYAKYFDSVKRIYLEQNQDSKHCKADDGKELSNESRVTICPNLKCQRKIEEPILLKSLSTAQKEQYYACPHCFTKLEVDIENVQPQKEEETMEKEKPSVELIEKEERGSLECPHHLGYLAKRPKDAPIPQGCLICSKIVKCMLKLDDV